eukprot:m.199129 g.199129  ORF g.199129 m.199129 type:complete len:118 (-) comp10656_c0_seq1:1537-1890(-)
MANTSSSARINRLNTALRFWEAEKLVPARDTLLEMLRVDKDPAVAALMLRCIFIEQPKLIPKPNRDIGICHPVALLSRAKSCANKPVRADFDVVEAHSQSARCLKLLGDICLRFFET